MKNLRIAIFASGAGSNAIALIKKMKELSSGKIEFLLSDRNEALVLEKAMHEGIQTYLVEKKTDTASHELEILRLIDKHQVDWILLAGYMRLISSEFLKSLALRHQGQVQLVNIHPSLLPAYPGAKAIERAFADKVPESGVTIHFVDKGMDTGEILAQEKVQILHNESFQEFKSKIHNLEHQMYTQLLEKIVSGKIPTNYFEEVIEC
jgi:phosphoribosylglycinamide formyltransferase-1